MGVSENNRRAVLLLLVLPDAGKSRRSGKLEDVGDDQPGIEEI